MLGRSTRHRRSTALRRTARITALSISAAMMVGGAALTASAASLTDPANCTEVTPCGVIDVYIDDPTGMLTAEDIPTLRASTSVELINEAGQSVASVSMGADSISFEKIESIPAGTYTLKATLPEGYKTLEMTSGARHWAAGSLTSDPFQISAYSVQVPLGIAPDVPVGTVTVDLFSDMDQDGVKDVGETGLSGFSGGIYPVGGGAQVAGLKASDLAAGRAVATVRPGTYSLNMFSSEPGWGWLNGTFGNTNTGQITVTADQTTSVSFGVKDNADCVALPSRCGTLSTYVFTEDAQGTRTPRAGVQLALVDANTNTKLKYATSDAAGAVTFKAPPGFIAVEVVYADKLDVTAGGDFDSSTNRTAQQTVVKQATTQVELALAAGDGIGSAPVDEREQGTLSVRGYVDTNGSGEYDADDEWAEAWATVQSEDVDPLLVKYGSAVTLPQGEYTFVVSQQPAGWKAVSPNGTFTLGAQHTLNIAMEETDVAPVGKALVRVDSWYDVDADGTKDETEAPAPDLYFVLNHADGTNLDWADTNDSGLAVFEAQSAGQFSVQLSFDPKYDPAGLKPVSGDLNAESLESAIFAVAADETKTLKVGVVDDEHPQVAAPPTTTPGDGDSSTPPGTPGAGEAIKVTQGEAITVRGEGFTAGETVEVWVHSDPIKLGQTVSADSGAVVAEVTIPRDLPAGAHRIELKGLTSGVSTWTDIQVAAAPGTSAAAPAGSLASTGAGQLGMLLLGIGLALGIGGVLVVGKPNGARAAA